jgi:hypothetical protein
MARQAHALPNAQKSTFSHEVFNGHDSGVGHNLLSFYLSPHTFIKTELRLFCTKPSISAASAQQQN